MRSFTLVSLFVVCALHAETMGWRIPLERFTSELHPEYAAPDHRVPQLEKHPAKSAFFKKGDQLLDLSKILNLTAVRTQRAAHPFSSELDLEDVEESPHQCEWVVWNKRSGMIVAKGSSAQLLLLDHQLKINSLPCQVRSTVTLKTTEGAKHTLMLSGRNSEESELEGPTLACKVSHWVTEDREFINSHLSVDYRQPNGDVFEIRAKLGTSNHSTVRVAEWEESGSGWTMDIHTRTFTPAGVPFDEIRWVENDGKLENYRVFYGSQAGPTTASRKINGLLSRTFDVPPDYLTRIAHRHNPTPDPFAKDPLPEMVDTLENEGAVDVRSHLGDCGVSFDHPGSMAVFSLNPPKLFVCNDEENLHLVEQMTLGSVCNPPPVVSVRADWKFGHAQIASNSGEIGSINYKQMDETQGHLEVASNAGSNNHCIDLKFALKPVHTPLSLGYSLTLFNATEVEAARFSSDGDEHPVKMAAEIQNP